MGKLKKDKVCITCRNKFRKLYNQKCWVPPILAGFKVKLVPVKKNG